jgi:hypothetical protein
MAAVAPQADLRSARIRNGGTWLAVAALAVALTGCYNDVGRTDAVWVRNNTDVTLHFTFILWTAGRSSCPTRWLRARLTACSTAASSVLALG